MIILGINDSSHDASVSVVEDGKILFAAHSERFNKEKNTFIIDSALLDEALFYGKPDVIAYFEKRALKRWRQFFHGGANGAYSNLYRKVFRDLSEIPEIQVAHHHSHAAAGFYTSQFEEATVVVIDAIGEIETATVWRGSGNELDKVYSIKYPLSFGLFYSAFTKLLGLVPGTDEYILMGMAGFGEPQRYLDRVNAYFPSVREQRGTMIRGIEGWDNSNLSEQDKFDIAAAVQHVYSQRLIEFMLEVRRNSPSNNLVFMGGCALNCSANRFLLEIWDDVWIMPNPGDSGSCLGAALAITKTRAEWHGPYLGHEIFGDYPVDDIIQTLGANGIVGVANGRAEFGPRALGNRSLLADPRTALAKRAVNEIKRREPFRPFAPVVLEEKAHEWFEMDRPSPYMQYAFKCKRPSEIPSVVHVDGTSRVQTVNKNQHPGLYEVLRRWDEISGIPVLLNTSLNIKGQPLINDLADVDKWLKINPTVKIAV